MTPNDLIFQQYVWFVLDHEGLTSSRTSDTASRCAPYPGAVHTVKGVTYCTFKQNAAQLGITPVTYSRFLNLTNSDVAAFIYLFAQMSGAQYLAAPLGISITEAAWGSGPKQAVMTLQRALNDLGADLVEDGDLGPLTRAAVQAADPGRLYNQFWIERKAFIEYLISHGYSTFANGWRNRISDFLQEFPYQGSGPITIIALICGFLLIKNRRVS